MLEDKDEPLGRYLSVAYRAFFSQVDSRLKDSGIDAEELYLLMALFRDEPLHQKKLCDIFNRDKATVGRRLERLENDGLITRGEDPEDRRNKLVRLTEKSRRKRPEFRKIFESIEDEIRDELSQEEIEQFLTSIKKICKVLRE